MAKKRLPTWRNYPKPSGSGSTTLSESDRLRKNNSGEQPQAQPKGSVNETLQRLRLSNAAASSAPRADPLLNQIPYITPGLKCLLHISDVPAPPPRQQRRFDSQGRRLPSGPPPPKSWLDTNRTDQQKVREYMTQANKRRDASLPGGYMPHESSLLSQVVQKIASCWDHILPHAQDLNLTSLPPKARELLIQYLDEMREQVTTEDLRAILMPSPDEDGYIDTRVNRGISHLYVPRYICENLGTLESVLIIPESKRRPKGVPESWEDDDFNESSAFESSNTVVPSLTHIHLGLTEHQTQHVDGDVIWKDLLRLSKLLPTITHVNLSHWPAPTTLEGSARWPGIVSNLRHLSKNWHRLVYLNMTGCDDWAKALLCKREVFDPETCTWEGPPGVDWANDWGRVKAIVMPDSAKEASTTHETQSSDEVTLLRSLRLYIMKQRTMKKNIVPVAVTTVEI